LYVPPDVKNPEGSKKEGGGRRGRARAMARKGRRKKTKTLYRVSKRPVGCSTSVGTIFYA
jgi:hypothetical protein